MVRACIDLLDLRALLRVRALAVQTKAVHWGQIPSACAALVGLRPAELRSCLIESAHLVFGAASWSFPAMHVWVEVIDSSGRDDCMRWRCPNEHVLRREE